MRPPERDVRIGAALILLAGLAAAGISLLAESLGLGEEAAEGIFGCKRISLLAVGIAVAATGAALLARPAIASPTANSRLERRLEAALRRHRAHLGIALLALLGLVLAWTRLMHIGESLWHDEAHAVLTHNRSPLEAFGGHVLYHQLTWATTSLLGESEPTLRLWSAVPGIAAVGIAAWWAWLRLGVVVSVAFATLAVAAPMHLDLVPQARGYGLTLLAATLMLVAADRLTRTHGRWALLGFLGAGLVGIWTLIFFAFSFLGQVLSLLRWPRLRLMAAGVLVAAGILSFAFHRPIGQAQVDGETISLGAALLLERTLEWLVLPTAVLLGADPGTDLIDHPRIPGWLFLGPLALIVLAAVALRRRGDGGLALLLLLPPLCFNLAFSLGDLNTVARHQVVLLPHVFVLVAIGIAELGRLATRPVAVRAVAVAAGVVAVLALSKATLDDEQARSLPPEAFKDAAAVVNGTDIETVVTDSSRPTGLHYYLGDERLDVLPAEWVEALICNPDGETVYIRHVPWPGYETASIDCLIESNATRMRIPQRARGYAIDVWIVEPQADRDEIRDDVPYARGS